MNGTVQSKYGNVDMDHRISSVLSEKKDNLSHKKTRNVGIGADTLAGFSDDIKDLKSWKEFEKTLGNGSSSMDACRKSANKLATEWVNSNNFLSNLNDTNKDYYISTLKEMGVSNAETVVHQVLNGSIKKQNGLKAALKKENIDVANATWDEVKATNAYTSASNNTQIAIAGLYAKENILKNNDLGLNEKAEQLQNFANSALEASVAQEIANQAFHDTAMAEKGGMDTKQYQKLYNKSYIDEFNKRINKINKIKLVKVTPTPVTSGSGSKDSGSKTKNSGDAKTKDSKEEISDIIGITKRPETHCNG